ncbi:hypothetical protein ACFE04_017238 [Oxalis oulophora]
MHVAGRVVDLKWLVELLISVLLIALTLLHIVKTSASKYFQVDAKFGTAREDHQQQQQESNMPGFPIDNNNNNNEPLCVVCSKPGTNQCSACKSVKYCSSACQISHWKSGHKTNCKKVIPKKTVNSSGICLVPGSGSYKIVSKKAGKVLFPYDEFKKLFNWDTPGFPPCGLLNCGNSCFANVVLQCLTSTKPLVAYLLDQGHQSRHNDWCFLCEFQTHVQRASRSQQPFSPIGILSRLPNISGNLGNGRQEDAHEFMRFAIDMMQSVCLDEYGGEKAIHPSIQETTLIQHIFGGHLQSQVTCTKCNRVSNQYENMMDLTVEIHGDVASLEECLDQFTTKEWLHGDNMYKCDGCNDYVKAWKRLLIRRPPNILTIALKRFQGGRFGKLNKRVGFPETLDLSPYMSEEGGGSNVYRLYAVVVHIDMLNASFFGHYICYTKDFSGNWYRIDDCKVMRVDLDEVLSQGAYMLLYSRNSPRPSYLNTEEPIVEGVQKVELEPCPIEQVKSSSSTESINPSSSSASLSSEASLPSKVSAYENESPIQTNSEGVNRELADIDMISHVSKEVSVCESESSIQTNNSEGMNEDSVDIDVFDQVPKTSEDEQPESLSRIESESVMQDAEASSLMNVQSSPSDWNSRPFEHKSSD